MGMGGRLVWVVVLGDFGRSPRMQYHTWSLLEAGYVVHVIALPGAALIPQLRAQPLLTVHRLRPPPPALARLPTLLALLGKVAVQLWSMLWLMLVALPRPGAILVQNPPAIPALALCRLAAARHRAALLVDWHNLAYSIMQLKYAAHPWLIALARRHERAMGRAAHRHFCVTEAMQAFLATEFGVQATVLYDRPPAFFAPLAWPDRHALFSRLQDSGLLDGAQGGCLAKYSETSSGGGGGGAQQPQGATLISVPDGSGGGPRRPRPALLVSSTSWTPDEDFGLLLEAAQHYDAAAGADDEGCPDLLCLITGRGPQRDMYLARIRALSLRRVAFCSLWLEPEDYPRLLGCADLGVCLHTSSSGLDLPMKVVDMYGAGLPVCAVDYACVRELVRPGVTGLLFKDGAELGRQLLGLFRGWGAAGGGGGGGAELQRLRAGVEETQLQWRWTDNWLRVARPVVDAAVVQRWRHGTAAAGAAAAAAAAGAPAAAATAKHDD